MRYKRYECVVYVYTDILPSRHSSLATKDATCACPAYARVKRGVLYFFSCSIDLTQASTVYHNNIGLNNILFTVTLKERSGSVVECLTRDRRAAGSSLTGVSALWSLSKTHLSYLSTGSTQEDPSL